MDKLSTSTQHLTVLPLLHTLGHASKMARSVQFQHGSTPYIGFHLLCFEVQHTPALVDSCNSFILIAVIVCLGCVLNRVRGYTRLFLQLWFEYILFCAITNGC